MIVVVRVEVAVIEFPNVYVYRPGLQSPAAESRVQIGTNERDLADDAVRLDGRLESQGPRQLATAV